MQRRDFLKASLAASAMPAFGAAPRPNLIVIMADDMGFSDLGCYGSEIDTPNINRLAEKGLRFTQFYNTARCCPTRASLLTGLYSHQAGIGHMMADYGVPGYRGDLNRNCRTIAEVLRTAGYRTAMSGKWHVTPHTADKHNWPLQRGFERYFGTIAGSGSYYNPATLVRDNEYTKPDGDNFYYTDAIGRTAAEHIDAMKGDDPFFLYVAFTSPHWPLQCPEETVTKYAHRYDEGWDALRQERHARMKKLGLVKGNWELTPRDKSVPAWKDTPNKEWEARRMAVFAAMIDRMDQAIGKILAKLEETKQLDNTLILMLADNGGCAEGMGEQHDTGSASSSPKPELTHDGRVVRYGNKPSIMPGPEDTFTSYATPWANVSNTPFRMYKHWVHEGGISSPLIAHWPAVLKRRGGLTDEPGHLIDIMATCVDAAKAKYPTEAGGEKIHPMEGLSLLPILSTGKRKPHDAIYWEHEGNQAIRMGRWKLVKRYGEAWELYDLSADRTELNNLAAAQPDRVKAMAKNWDAWAARSNVLPWQSWKKA